ncbi:MAG: glycine cleavage system aminomethyltransferase GcvT [Fibrobacteria bacterium]|nr:glycine cleavage system aminomethyltransferase GcvT [Fibrobacteria bacterium]
MTNTSILRTPFYERHVALGAKLVDFAGWRMPIQYQRGIIQEHLSTRKTAGLFDVSHMGRFLFSGSGAVTFLQHVLSNNVASLQTGKSQYTIIPDSHGNAHDDAYLYRFYEHEYLLVVNASNKTKDWEYFLKMKEEFTEVVMEDVSEPLSMLSLQGSLSENIIKGLTKSGKVPECTRNSLAVDTINGANVLLARTGYTGEPLCFELFMGHKDALSIWDLLMAKGATAIGLGARDTLRLEAGLPLYGHEFGEDVEGKPIPLFACPLSRFAVSFAETKSDFVGREALLKQFDALKKINSGDYSQLEHLPRIIRAVAVTGKGIAREGAKVWQGEERVGYITSGTMVPYWKPGGDEHANRAICLALLNANLKENSTLEIEVRGRKITAIIVSRHLRSDTPPHAQPVLYEGNT